MVSQDALRGTQSCRSVLIQFEHQHARSVPENTGRNGRYNAVLPR